MKLKLSPKILFDLITVEQNKTNVQAFYVEIFHIHTLHLDMIKVLLPNDAQENALKGVLKFTLKMLRHVSV